MPIRFAAKQSRTQYRMPRGMAQGLYMRPANDNRGKRVSNTHLHAALRHFAQHGLAAADHACQQAMAAAEAGDRQTYEWWVEICRALDRRLAHSIDDPARVGG